MESEAFLNIVIFSAEATPYVKVGGLADVVGALSRMLARLGTKVTLVLPAYQAINSAGFAIRPSEAITPFDVPLAGETVRASALETLGDKGMDVYFVSGGDYFARQGIYDNPATGEGYPDNMERYIFFVRAGLELLRRRGERVDVIHCHDAQTALIPGLLQTVYQDDALFSSTGTLLTIHNLAYQSVYPKECLALTGIEPHHFYPSSPYEYWGKVNCLKAGIETADRINTVSQTYALEIQSDPEYGCGLEGVLKRRSQDLSGIINGIDYSEWNPETDPLIPAHYSAEDLAGKETCKKELLSAFGLKPIPERAPLVGIVSRLADQKGFDLIGSSMEQLADLNLQMVVLGAGRHKYHKLLQHICTRFPERFAVRFGFDNPLAHMIEAGADMFLMPSRYEPCGLNQLYSLRYGTVPIVRSTGGLADTVTNFDILNNSGTGFTFQEYSPRSMMLALRRALMVYEDPIQWEELAVRGMLQNWSWEKPAREYLRLYRQICQKRQA
jgi:starch synthase